MWKNEMDDCKVNQHLKPKSRKIGVFKKTMISTVVGIGITCSVVYANDVQLSTVYHVYIDGEHVGTVNDKSVVESYINSKIDSQEQNHKGYSFTIDEELTYVAEKVFEPKTANEDVIRLLSNEISLKVNAIELKIGDKVLGYFKDTKTAEEAITAYKANYVNPNIIELLEDITPNVQQVDPTLSVGRSKVVDVKLSEKVSFSSEKVSPNEILTKKEAQKLLKKGTLEDKIHIVKEGEVLGGIAANYNLDLETILELNPDLTEDSLLQIGQEINVTDYEPFIDVIVKKETLEEEKIKFETKVIESDDLYKGTTKVKQEGQNGKKEVHYSMKIVNGKISSKEVIKEKVIKEPVKEVVIKGTKVIPSRGTGELTWPTVGGDITSRVGIRWGAYHKGIDIAGVSNRSILAADNGVVEFAGWDSGYGNKIVIDHNNGYKTIYAHMSALKVSRGDTVVKGSKIGIMGTTGNSTGIHLHFEVYKNGKLLNPLSLY